MKYPNAIQFEVSGRYALFTDPITKTGGEKCSYPVPTFEALKGILSSIYWLPDITWVVDKVRIMEPIQTESVPTPIRNYFNTNSDLCVYTYLRNVRYRIMAHFIPRDSDIFTPADEHRHYHSALRALAKGGRRDIYLGTRDCPCAVTAYDFNADTGYYDNTIMDLGLMFHGFSYQNESTQPIAARYFHCCLENGVITFPLPAECTLVQQLCQEEQYALV